MFGFVDMICEGLMLSDNMIIFLRLIVLYMILRFACEFIRALGGTFK